MNPYVFGGASTELTTDTGLLVGALHSDWVSHLAGIYTFASVSPSTFKGSLDVRVDLTRPLEARTNVNLALREQGTEGQLFSLVNYKDGQEPTQDEGEGFFWPAVGGSEPHCGWLDLPTPSSAPLVSFDDLPVMP